MDLELTGKLAVIFGASKSIGRPSAEVVAEGGCRAYISGHQRSDA